MSLLLAVVAGLLLAVMVRAQAEPDPADHATADAGPASGMALIERYRCHPGETRRVSIKGVEDGYSSSGREPADMHPRLPDRFIRLAKDKTDYDSHVQDGVVGDWFELPGSTTSAMLVIRYRLMTQLMNETLLVGNAAEVSEYVSIDSAKWEAREGWMRHDDIHWVDFARVETPSGLTLTEVIRSSPGGRIVDVLIQDDTSVDFMAVAWCEAPQTRMGVTLHTIPVSKDLVRDVAAFECRPGESDEPNCNPFVGDRPCDSAAPMLCFRDLNLPRPPDADRYSALTSRRWSGGEVAATEPVRASRFATITDADRYCARMFGPDWRVAEWAAGGAGYGFAARAGGRTFSGRHWIDIRGSPYGTCWTRDRDR